MRVAWVSRPLASAGTLLAPEDGGTVPAALRHQGSRRHDPGSPAGGRYLRSELFGAGLFHQCTSCTLCCCPKQPASSIYFPASHLSTLQAPFPPSNYNTFLFFLHQAYSHTAHIFPLTVCCAWPLPPQTEAHFPPWCLFQSTSHSVSHASVYMSVTMSVMSSVQCPVPRRCSRS